MSVEVEPLLRPSEARVYDYLVGGYTHAGADRELARRVLEVAPWAGQLARQHRRFGWRAVRCMLAAGVRQFVDLGGVLTVRDLHEIPAAREAGVRVIYVDCDPLGCDYGRRRLAGNRHAAVVQAEVGDPAMVLRQQECARLLDGSQPCGLLMLGALFTAWCDPGRLVAAWRRELASGSYLALTQLSLDQAPPPLRRQVAGLVEVYRQAGQKVRPRGREEVTGWLSGMPLLSPGLVLLPDWRPEPYEAAGAAGVLGFGAVARQS